MPPDVGPDDDAILLLMLMRGHASAVVAAVATRALEGQGLLEGL